MEIITREEIARLTPPERLAERLELIGQLWDSLEQEQVPVASAQQEELARRLTSLHQDRLEGITWTALKAELEQRSP